MEDAQSSPSGSVRPSTLRNFDAAPGERFDIFRKRFEAFAQPHKVAPNQIAPDQFMAELKIVVTENTQTGYCATSPMFLSNPQSEIAHARDDRIIFYALSAGTCVIEARSTQNFLPPGSLSLFAPSEEYRLIGDHSHESYMCNVPTDKLSVAKTALRTLSFSSLTSDHGITSMFSNSLVGLFHAQSLNRRGIDIFMTGLADLVLRSTLGLDPDHADTHVVRRAQVERFVRNNIANANLHADLIASELRISRRLLYRLFEGKSETLSELIQRERVLHAKRLVETMRNDELSLEQLARMSGFSSTRTFMRAFQRILGISPAHHVRSNGI